jgi:GNAT superfamily N-acetyltransferase
MIRRCTESDLATLESIINEAAEAYRGVIPADCWHDPYLPREELVTEIAAGVEFWAWDEGGAPVGVMGLQRVRDVTLIRHAYVRPSHQSRGVGRELLNALVSMSTGRLLVGHLDGGYVGYPVLRATRISARRWRRKGSVARHLLEHLHTATRHIGRTRSNRAGHSLNS